MNKVMTRITVAAVPEQVNIPIKICLERGIFSKHNIDVNYVVVPEGTGTIYCYSDDVAIAVAEMIQGVYHYIYSAYLSYIYARKDD